VIVAIFKSSTRLGTYIFTTTKIKSKLQNYLILSGIGVLFLTELCNAINSSSYYLSPAITNDTILKNVNRANNPANAKIE